MSLDEIAPFVYQVAKEVRRQFPMVELADLQQEGFLWHAMNPTAAKEYLEHEDKRQGARMLYSALRNRLRAYARQEKAHQLGYSVTDERYYTTGEIKQLLTMVWEEEEWSAPSTTESSIGRSKTPANERGNWLASLCDVMAAMKHLSERDRWLLEQKFRYDEPQSVIAEEMGLAESSVSEAIDRAVRKIHDKLGGSRPRDRENEIGSRSVISNAAAQAIQQKAYDG